MIPTRLPCAPLSVLALALGLAACAPRAASVAGGGPAGTTSPANVQEQLEAERWEQATRGLDFDSPSGLVEVERIFAGDPVEAARRLSRADESLRTNHVLAALEDYALAARYAPELPEAYVGLGVVLRRKGRLDEALAALRTAVDREPRHRDARYQLALTLWTAAEREEAIARMTALADDDDAFADAHERLAVWSYYAGDPQRAWIHLHRAEALGHPVPAQLVPLLERQLPDPEAPPGREN